MRAQNIKLSFVCFLSYIFLDMYNIYIYMYAVNSDITNLHVCQTSQFPSSIWLKSIRTSRFCLSRTVIYLYLYIFFCMLYTVLNCHFKGKIYESLKNLPVKNRLIAQFFFMLILMYRLLATFSPIFRVIPLPNRLL